MRAPTTPSSLKWLINRHARIQGELKKLERAEAQRRSDAAESIAKLQMAVQMAQDSENVRQRAYERLCETHKSEIEAVELLLGRHEVPIDPSIIRPVRSQDNVSIVEYGTYTRLIYECLRLANGKPCTATQVAVHMTISLEWNLDKEMFAELRYQTRKRMNDLARERKISRAQNQVGSVEGRWCLNPDEIPLGRPTGRPRTRRPDDSPANSPATTETTRS